MCGKLCRYKIKCSTKIRKGYNGTLLCTAYYEDSLLMYCLVWETVEIQSQMQYNKWEKAVTVLCFVLHKSGFFAHVLSCVRNCAKSNAVRKMRKGCNSTFLYCINQDSLLVYCHVWETVQIQNTMQYNKWEKAVVVLFVLHKSGLFAYVLSCVGNCADTKSSAVQK